MNSSTKSWACELPNSPARRPHSNDTPFNRLPHEQRIVHPVKGQLQAKGILTLQRGGRLERLPVSSCVGTTGGKDESSPPGVTIKRWMSQPSKVDAATQVHNHPGEEDAYTISDVLSVGGDWDYSSSDDDSFGTERLLSDPGSNMVILAPQQGAATAPPPKKTSPAAVTRLDLGAVFAWNATSLRDEVQGGTGWAASAAGTAKAKGFEAQVNAKGFEAQVAPNHRGISLPIHKIQSSQLPSSSPERTPGMMREPKSPMHPMSPRSTWHHSTTPRGMATHGKPSTPRRTPR